MVEKKYTLWVGGIEVNDYALTKNEVDNLYDEYISQGYDDVQIAEY